jgi:sulfite reductase (ferredoxin)
MPKLKGGQGQWALGHREPLNPTEQQKKDDDGLKVRERILTRYAQEGFDSIDAADLRQRLKWFGLYTQRRPGIDGGKTGVLEPDDIEDRYFMLRVRIPGGRLSSAQLRAIGAISRDCGRNVADITDRQNVQLHWIRIEDVPEIWQALDDVGLSTTEACGDTPRNMLGCPLAGIDADEVIDATSALSELQDRFVGDPAFSNLPRKYKTALSGCAAQCTLHEINDTSFVGVVGPDGQPGYDLWVGGGLSTNPTLAQRLGVFVAPERVSEVWAGVTGVFRDYGYRRSRHRARLKFLVKDWGPQRFREVLESEYLGDALPDGPPPAPSRGAGRDHVGVHRQRDGRCYVGFAPRSGRTSGGQLLDVANLAARYGAGRVHTTIEQKLVILGVPDDDVAPLVDELEARDLRVRPSVFRRGTMACTGLEFCKLAIVETKGRAVDLYTELERRLPDFDAPVSINVNGCPNSCARFQLADIGLKGSLVPGADGQMVEGFQVHLGGMLGAESALGRKVRGLKVTADDLVDYVERVLRNYQAHRDDGESVGAWLRRVDESLVQ